MVEALGSEIDSLISGNKVLVFSKSWCPFASQAKQLLQSKGITMKVVELDQVANGDQMQGVLQQKTGQRTVPSIFINGEHIGGNSDLQSLNSSGGLEAKIGA